MSREAEFAAKLGQKWIVGGWERIVAVTEFCYHSPQFSNGHLMANCDGMRAIANH
jgi:hypothetical protein